MRVVIIGAGHDGAYLAERLAAEGQDVVIIEVEEAKAAMIQDRLDALVITGNGASPTALRQAGADKAGLVLAVTDRDSTNVMASHTAKEMGAHRTVARVEDRDLREISPSLGVDVIIDARESLAREVLGLIHYAGASDFVEFAGGKLVLVGGRVRHNSSAAGRSVSELRSAHAWWQWVLAATVRDGIPTMGRGHTRVEAEDHALFIVRQPDVNRAIDLMGISSYPVRRVVLLGGTRAAEYTADLLLAEDYEAVIVERDLDRSEEIARRSLAMVIHGDPTEPEVLNRLGLGRADVVVGMSGWDEVNLMGCMVAKAVGAGRTIARFGRFAVAGLLKDVGIDATVSARVAAANAILRYVRRNQFLSVATFKDTQAEAIEIEVAPQAPAVGWALRDLSVPDGTVIGGFIRGREAFLPTGDTVIQGRDHLLVVAVPGDIEAVEHLFVW
jgi:trk system potassium uptake protein TrkA